MTIRGATILVLCESTVSPAIVIPLRTEITRVAASAETLVLRVRVSPPEGIVNGLTIIGMTINTSYATIVVARVVTATAVDITPRRSPAACCMTDVALLRGVKMAIYTGWGLRGRASTTKVTIFASTDSIATMEPRAAHEGCGGMAVEAIQRCIEVAYILTDRFVRKTRVAA